MSKHREPVVRHATRRVAVAGVAAVLAIGVSVVALAPSAEASTFTVTTETQLRTDLALGSADTLVLGMAITVPAGPGLTVGGTKTLDLNGFDLNVTALNTSGAALSVPGGVSLTIESSAVGGTLEATGKTNGAGIGGSGTGAGTIVISSGSITAQGGSAGVGTGGGAGIGGGTNGGGGSVTVNGGSVTAQGGSDGAGIGGGHGASGGSFTMHGGSVSATGGTNGAGIGGGSNGGGGSVDYFGGALATTGGSSGAGIGGGNAGNGSGVVFEGGAPGAGDSVIAAGGTNGAGIGGGNGGSGGTVALQGTATQVQVHHNPDIFQLEDLGKTVVAAGNAGGAGVGGGTGGSGANVTVTGGTLTANGSGGGAGVGGGSGGGGGTVLTNTWGQISAAGASNAPDVGPGSGSASFGSLTNHGTLEIPLGTALYIPVGVTVVSDGTLLNNGALRSATSLGNGVGTFQNDGSIINNGTIENNGDGGGQLTVSDHNYVINYDANGGTGLSPASQRVYAGSVFASGQVMPTVTPPSGATLLGFYTATTGGTLVNGSADLATIFGSGPVTVTAHAQYRQQQTISFAQLPNQTFTAGATFPVSAAAPGGAVTFTAAPSGVCTMFGASTVQINGAGACTVTASQAGGTYFFPATPVHNTFQITTGALVIPVIGSQNYGGAPTFMVNPSWAKPSDVDVSGALTCTNLAGGAAIIHTLPVGNYTIDANSCGGIGLTGAGASNYTFTFSGGTFTVNPGPLQIIATGTQTYGGSPTFAPVVTLPPGVSLTGTLHCTGLDSPTVGPISPTLAVGGAYSIDHTTCSGLTLSGAPASNYSFTYVDGALTVIPAPITVTATGTQGYGGSPTFTPQYTAPSGVTVGGSLFCTKLTSNIAISPTLGVGGVYTIDHTSCSGLVLGGTNAGNYSIAYANGPFTVGKAHVSIVSHTNSIANANSIHKFVFTATVTNTDANQPIAGITVTWTERVNALYTMTCKGTTDSSGVATCTNGSGNLFLPPENRSYTAATPATAQYLAATTTAVAGS